MATIYNYYLHYVHTAIGMLMEAGYLGNELDWDVCRGKFTLRIRNTNQVHLTVLVITFRRKDNTIIVADTGTHKQTEFPLLVSPESNNLKEFWIFLRNYIQEISK